MNIFSAAALALTISTTGVAVCAPANAQAVVETTAASLPSGDLIKKSKKLKGSYEVVERNGKHFIVLSEDFRAAKGPDLKIFLSPKSISDVTGKTAIDGSVNIGELKSTKGTQEYEIPAGIDLADYASVLVHCEAYAVLWGGADL